MRLINRKPSRTVALFLGLVPFVVLLLVYVAASSARLADNPADKLLPSFATMFESFRMMALQEDVRSGDRLLWLDTAASLWRLGVGLSISAILGLAVGVFLGFLPYGRAFLAPFISAFSLIPPITVLPILFIVLGLGEAAKIGLIVIGTAPAMIRQLAQSVLAIPPEELVKAQTLGATSWQIALRVVLPQVWPALIGAIRLGLIPAWIFLISAEAIASTEGLGYRIFLVRRYLAMDVIVPYVAWITLIAYAMDRGLAHLSRRAFRWAHLQGDAL
jgi:NitT/TauT family transport system permease protein